MKTKQERWIAESKKAYNVLKSLSKKDLTLLADKSGLSVDHYDTKSLLAKGLLIKLCPCLPDEMTNWT